MPKVYRSMILDVPAARAWAAIRDFNNLPSWHPLVEESVIESGMSAPEVGCIRRLVLGDGAVVRETLLDLDDVACSYRYDFVESPFPVRRYDATLRVTPVTDGDRAFVEWFSWFESEADQESAMSETFAGIYEAGFESLKQRLG